MNLKGKITPGPWEVQRTISGNDYALEFVGDNGDGEPKFNVYVTAPQYVVAGVGGVGKWECLANARLIAAAPELLRACEFALGQLEGLKPRGGCHAGSVKADIEILKSAISKAKCDTK